MMNRDVVQDIRNHNHTFFPILRDVTFDVLAAAQATAIAKWIEEHAEAINVSKYGATFEIFQRYSHSELFLMMGRIFDDDDRKQISIKRVISEIPKMQLFNRTRFVDFLKVECRTSRNLDGLAEQELLDCGCSTILKSRPTLRSSPSLKRIISVRHNEIAHRAEGQVTDRPYWVDVADNLAWAKKFISAMGESFFDSDICKGINFDSAVRTAIIRIERVAHDLHILTSEHWQKMERLSQMAQG